LYSVGVVLYEMLTGKPPFGDMTGSALLSAHQAEAPPPFEKRCPGLAVPRPIEAVVQKCLSKHREHRPQSANELAQLYEKALGHKIVLPLQRPAPGTALWTPRNNGSPGSAPGAASVRAAAASGANVEAAVITPMPTPKPALDPNAVSYELHVRIPETMAMLKLRGFVQDLGGQLVEGDSGPGVIRVRLVGNGQGSEPWAKGVSSFSGSGGRSASLSRKDLKERYDKIYRDLKAYLQAT
jgi:serine/threonine protein kinase